MAVVRRIRNRGATTTVESHAEIMFMPGGSVDRWNRKFVGRIRASVIAAAPTNKRPRWAHYGKPLKDTIISAKPQYRPTKSGARIYAAVGSKAPHAHFVDQGTGVFAGGSPYEAKILPPWQHGGASLYERTWRPGGPGTRRVAPVMIKGQEGQFFFDKGLAAAFRYMKIAPSARASARISEALGSIPSGLENFVGSGNTGAVPAFTGQLNEWRKWRDEAWAGGKPLGRGAGVGSRAHERAVAAGRNKPRGSKTVSKPKVPKKPKPARDRTLRDKQNDAVSAFVKQNPKVQVLARIPAGIVVVAPNTGTRVVIPWSRLYNLI